MKKWLIIFLIVIALAAGLWLCFAASFFKEPLFTGMRDLQILRMEDHTAVVAAKAVFSNPNPVAATLLNTELKAYSNEVLIAQVSQTHIADVPASGEFVVPLQFSVDLLRLGVSQSISGMLEHLMSDERVIPVKFEGYCRIRSSGQVYKIPVLYEDKLIFR